MLSRGVIYLFRSCFVFFPLDFTNGTGLTDCRIFWYYFLSSKVFYEVMYSEFQSWTFNFVYFCRYSTHAWLYCSSGTE